jgi:hypothetical protein
VHDRQGALRQAQYDARQLPRGAAIFVVLDPSYRTVGVVGSGSGRTTSPRVSRRAKALALEMFVGPVQAKKAERAARRSARAEDGRGRGSRKPARTRW